MKSVGNILVLLVTVIAFAGLGALVGHAQFNYENSTAKGSSVVYGDDATDKRRHMAITYGVAGAGLGIVLASIGSLQRQIRGAKPVVTGDPSS